MSKVDKPLPSLDFLNPRLRICRALALIGYLGLLATLLIYNALIADLHGANPWVIVGTLTVPLLIFMPGMLKGNIRTHAWLCFVVNLYFIYGVLSCFQLERMAYGALLTGLSLLFFVPAMGYVRWGFQAQRVINDET
ncbi:DUF2069 domain-containing protein [Halopseudomonas pelagia]|uniref:DUF2069 domain-containing protein n=1 Tax=Halopseudomonas pelagia TaxID=553151 RepID=UPI00039B0839|nr:DUF2069 domain-containing protein [Halopseudomonas pelagia]|tara:strand:+ start:201 stop:611 length:411 start_codon:yes stop_codon:yes gene_type:complete